MNNPSLPWWKKEIPHEWIAWTRGALWGFLFACLSFIACALIFGFNVFTPIIGYFDIPVFPLVWFFAHVVFLDSWGPHLNWILGHSIGWTIGGALYTYAFHAFKKRHHQK